MKKLIIIVAALVFSGSIFAQKGLEVGVYATPQSTWIFNQQDFDEGDNLNFRSTIGYTVGANLGFNFTNTIGIRTGLAFSRQGQNYIDDNLDIPFATKLSYIKVPLLVKFNSDPQAATAFLATLGVDLGILSGGKYSIDGEDLPTTFPFSDPKDDYNGFDLSAVVGFGLQARIDPRLNLNFMLRFSYSVLDIENEDAKPLGRETANHFIGGLQVGANYVLFGEE